MTATAAVASARGRGLLVLLFVVYLGILGWLVVFKLHEPFVGTGELRAVKLVPFVRTADWGASAPREVLGNIAVFVPFGIYLRLLAPSLRWWGQAGIVAATSLAFEITQYILAVGISDVTDVLANTAGGMLGVVLAALAVAVFGRRTGVVLGTVAAIITVLVLVAVAAFTAGLRPSPPGGIPSALSHAALTIDSCAC